MQAQGSDKTPESTASAASARTHTASLERLTRTRERLAQLLMGLGIFFLFTLVDVLILGRDSEQAPLRLVVGTSAAQRGRMPLTATRLEEVRVLSPSPALQLRLEKVARDFWLGLPQWQGEVRAAVSLPPGAYVFVLEGPETSSDANTAGTPWPLDQRQVRLEVHVFASEQALQAAEPSWLKRQSGLAPGWFSLLSGAGLLLGAAGVMQLSRLRAQALERVGKAEIFRVELKPEGLELWFGLGTVHGLQPGERLWLRAGSEQVLAELVVQVLEAEVASALWPGTPASLEKWHPVLLAEGLVQRRLSWMENAAEPSSHKGTEHV
ncbi:MAG: hypothetical protein ACKO6N_25550 [Myxococcota bacterium]